MSAVRTIGVVTTSRADYGIYRPVLRKILPEEGLKLHLIAAGMHWLESYGNSARQIAEDGFEIGAKVVFPLSKDSPLDISRAMGEAVKAFAESYAALRPDILMVLGDRFEMFSGCLAALPFKIPVAHIHGGELTLGAFDNSLRHAITKMAHLHFVTAPEYAARVRQLGEEPWRITVSGAPALDEIKSIPENSRQILKERFGLDWEEPPLLVTFHPVTLEYEETPGQIDRLLQALENFSLPMVFTAPNVDTLNAVIWERIKNFTSRKKGASLVPNLGTPWYYYVMANAAAMVGNSSSGIIEAASLELPVVNIGTRQGGRLRGGNVIDCGHEAEEITLGVRKALDPAFKKSLRGIKNPYGEGRAAEKIVAVLKDISIDQKLLLKSFADVAQ